VGASKLMRDPCIARGTDGLFHMVWTDSWVSATIGYASSPDLIAWSPQKALPVMAAFPGTRNCWAPEIVYDAAEASFLIFWASTIPGQSPDADQPDDGNHRIYATTTKDFIAFTPTRLLFDPGFNCIDSTLLTLRGRTHMFFKDERKVPTPMKNLRRAVADRPAGPYTVIDRPVTAPGLWVEGPSALQIGDETYLYFDAYRDHHYAAYRSRDLDAWEDVTSQLQMPRGARHGSAFAVPDEVLNKLLAHEAAVPATIVNPLVPRRADPHVTLHSDGYYYFIATVPAYDRIELRRARTIGALSVATPTVIWTKHAVGPMGAHVWAPELHHIDGKWYVYFAAGDSEKIWNIRMYVLENAAPNPLEGQWAEKAHLRTERDAFALDATTFAHRGGRYLIWAEASGDEPGTSLYIAAMDTPWSLVGPQVRIARPQHSWERIGHNVNEGPAVLLRTGRVFVTFSASATDANYCLGLLSAPDDADLLDPASWTKSAEPVFKSSRANAQFGPGHNSFTTTRDGKTDLIVYHARNYEEIIGEPLHNPDRATRVGVVRWRADGTPDFGEPTADGACTLSIA
jgi:GH43 family beta-xylosidase